MLEGGLLGEPWLSDNYPCAVTSSQLDHPYYMCLFADFSQHLLHDILDKFGLNCF